MAKRITTIDAMESIYEWLCESRNKCVWDMFMMDMELYPKTRIKSGLKAFVTNRISQTYGVDPETISKNIVGRCVSFLWKELVEYADDNQLLRI